MAKQITVHNESELQQYRDIIKKNLDKCVLQLQQLLQHRTSIEIFQTLKFEKSVTEPLSSEAENLIEVINQSMTYLVSVMAVEYLFNIYPSQSFIINWGNLSGYDIESTDGTIIGECFAATSYRSNNKLNKDLQRLADNDTAQHKYEFFYDKEFTENNRAFYVKKYKDIQIIKFDNMII